MALGRPAWREARATLQRLLSAGEGALRDSPALQKQALLPQSSLQMHLPASIGNFTDFYCSKEHATNCGVMFRGKDNPLQPNWLHLPVAYHGRASSIVVSGTDVRRPWGQVQGSAPGENPSFRPSAVLDFELEMVRNGSERGPLGNGCIILLFYNSPQNQKPGSLGSSTLLRSFIMCSSIPWPCRAASLGLAMNWAPQSP